ncbi:polysaccharide lyase family 1 protein [Kineosporia sp. J2-2]|uniref:Polysaccharide lyase family 1 protein n=1 Tax=Kineosporia corallincola TaxID=2835133 RepID=A0ABS5TRU3_9ACTN|nr:polysaccharide lyase family 1 protein [Kineosporia corallincola]MBT0773527.1 polysaccharide lyase family 1 protein [Kineosporia corallincola]
MKRRGKRVLGIGGAGVIAVAGVATAAVVNLQGANASEPASTTAASAGATGFAAQNGGTTGGAGGTTVTATTGTQIHEALCGWASEDTPITIQVKGTITVGNTAKVSGSCNTAAGVIELKGISNVTLVGVGSSAVFDQIGIHIRDSSNVILQNLTVKNVKKSGSPTSNGGDAVGMESDVHNVWADHLTLEASGGEDDGYDALFDMKSGTQYVTLSYSILRNSGRGGLVGSSDSDTGNGPVTYHHNYYQNIDSRTPLLRAATAHIYNNYYEGLTKSGINPRNGGKALVQNNYFKDSKNVLGTFYTNLKGTYQTSGNVLDNVTWTSADSENFPAGSSMTSTGTVTVPYSTTLDDASKIPSIVKATAGAGTGLAVSDGSGSTTTPTTSAAPTTSTPVTTTSSSSGSGTNLSLGAGADGSSKVSGTSYGNVIDGDESTYWTPTGNTGDISVKWSGATTVGSIVIKEASGSKITSWKLIDETNGKTISTGTNSGKKTFTPVSTKRLTFEVVTATGTTKITEFETYAS